MRTKWGFGTRTSKHPIVACAFIIGSTLAGYGDEFGDFTYEKHDTYVEITDYPRYATGDLIIPSEIVGKPVTSIGERAFSYRRNLTSVTIPDSVTSIREEAFAYCTSLTATTVNAANPAYSSVDGVLFDKSQTTLLQFPGGKTGSFAIPDSVTEIDDRAFADCHSLASVTIPDSVTSIGSNAFNSCSSLTSVTIPDSVTSIGDYAFFNCTSLTSVTIPDSLASIGKGAFQLCTSLTSVTIPDSVTTIGIGVFAGCTNLTAITVNAANSAYSSVNGVLFDKSQTTLLACPGSKAGAYTIPDSVTSIGDQAFRECSGLTSVTIPDSVASIGFGAFNSCSSLTSVTIPDKVTSIDWGAFISCTSLTSVAIPDSVTTIGDFTFANCTSLTSVTIPDGVTTIMNQAFNECDGLISVTVGSGVTSIDAGVFQGCTSLTSVYFKGNAPGLKYSRVILGARNATVYYVSGTTGWGETFDGHPTEETKFLPDPLIGGTPLVGLEGWFLSEWFGNYGAAFAPWLLHIDHGAIYHHPSSTNTSMYIYDDAMGAWWWTNHDFYPFIYAFDPPADNAGTDVESCWLWFFEDSKTPRVFGVATGADAGSFLYFNP